MRVRTFAFALLLFLSSSYYLLAAGSAFAQAASQNTSDALVEGAATLGIAHMIAVKDKNIPDGSIISTGTKGAVLSDQ
jgi:hypothetical protein